MRGWKRKGKAPSCLTTKHHEILTYGGVEAELQTLVTSAADGSGRLTPEVGWVPELVWSLYQRELKGPVPCILRN
jgi:hypothetical protein